MDFGLRGFVLWESSLTHEWQYCNYSFVLWQSFNLSHVRYKVQMRVAVFVEAHLVLTFIVLYFLSRLAVSVLVLFGCRRDHKYFWKNSEERWRWNLGLISHLLSMLFDWTLIDSQCWANRFSNLKVIMRSFSNGNQSLKIIFNYLVTKTQTAMKHQALSE